MSLDRADYGDVQLVVTDDGPAIEVGDMTILLRTFVQVADESKPLGYETLEPPAEIDCDGDNGCWFDLVHDEGDDMYPWVTIQPEILERSH